MADRLTQEQIAAVKQMDLSCEMPILCARKPFETWCLDCLLSAILAHIEADQIEIVTLKGKALTFFSQLEQAEAALREANEGNANWKQLWNQVVEAAGAQHVSVLSQVIKRIAHQRATVAQQAERIAQLEKALENVRWVRVLCGACGRTYRRCVFCNEGIWIASEGGFNQQCQGHRNVTCSPKCVLAALAASSAEPPTPNVIRCDQSHGGTPCGDPDCHVRFIDNEDESSSSLSTSGAQDESSAICGMLKLSHHERALLEDEKTQRAGAQDEKENRK